MSLFWRGPTVCSQVALRRTESQGDFTPAEVKRLEALHKHIDQVLDRLLTLEEDRSRLRWLEEFNHHLPFALLFLNLEMEPVYVNREAMEQCVAWNFGPEQAKAYQPREVFRVPVELLSACTNLKKQWLAYRDVSQGGPIPKFTMRQLSDKYPGFVANITLQMQAPCPTTKPGFVVHLTHGLEEVSDKSSLPVHSMLGKLTPAERDITRRVLLGQSNDEIAGGLHKSVYTVKSQLTSIYGKLDVRSRSQLMVRLR